MTTFDEPPPDWDEPPALLEAQAAEHAALSDLPPARSTTHVNGDSPRIPPHDLDLERIVLGNMLVSLNACDLAIEAGLTAADFYRPPHATIYRTICELLTAGEPPDFEIVRRHLPASTIDELGGDHALLAILTAGGTTKSNNRYAHRLRTLARARRLQSDATAIGLAAGTGDVDQALTLLARTVAHTHVDDTDTSWAPVDLTATLNGNGPPEPTMLHRDDGTALIYAGKVHAFNAESESGKSWLALHVCAERINEGEHVVYLDFEDDPADITARLLTLGVPTDHILERFHYLRPDDPINTVATAALERLLTDHQPSLAIIDGVTEVMVQNGWSITDNDDAARFLLALPRRIARHGAAVILIDHVTKDREGRGRYGIGAQHKLAGINGAAYHLEVTQPFGRGRHGTARITVTKDRPGHIRGAAVEGRFVAEMHLQSVDDDQVLLQLTARAGTIEPQIRPTNLMEKVSRSIETLNAAGVEPTRNGVLADVQGKKTFVQEALRNLIKEGHIEQTPGPNRAMLHRAVRPYRAATDPRSDAYQPDGDDSPEEEF